MSLEPKKNNTDIGSTKARTVTVATIAVLLLVAVVGVFANAGVFSLAFDPSAFLNDSNGDRSLLDQGDDSLYSNEDNAAGDKADVQGDSSEEKAAPQTMTPESGQAAGVSAARMSGSNGQGSVPGGTSGDGSGNRGAAGNNGGNNGDAGRSGAPAGSGAANDNSNGNGANNANNNGGSGGNDNGNGNGGNGNAGNGGNGGNGGGNGNGSGNGGTGGGSDNPGDGGNKDDKDKPPAVNKPAAMDGVSLLSLKHSGTAVFSPIQNKDGVNPAQNLADVKVSAVLYDKKSGTKWTRTLAYGNVDGQTYTISSDSFPVTTDTKSIKVVFYLYGERHEAVIPCVVGDNLTVQADSAFFDHLNTNQNVTEEQLAALLKVSLSDNHIDLSLCEVTGFDTSQAPGTYTATIKYAGLETTFSYTLNEVNINLHTPQTLVNCEERAWGHLWGMSPAGMKTLFNGKDVVTEKLNASSFDLTTYSQQLMGDLYYTEDCDSWQGDGKDPNFTTTYAKPGTEGQLDDWFVGWATADPAKENGPVDNDWLHNHLVDTQLSAADIAGIAKEQGTGGSIDLYPIMRSNTTISADDYIVKYNEHSNDWTMWFDPLEDRRPAQLLANFTSNAVKDGVLDVPAGVSYVSLSPYLTESGDASAYDSVKQVNLPIGILDVDQAYPFYGWPYYSDNCGLFVSADMLPNLEGFALPSTEASHGSSAYRTCPFTLEHEDGSTKTIYGLVNEKNQLTALPAAGIGKNDKLVMAEGTGVTTIASVSIANINAKSIEFASSVTQIDTGALRCSTFDEIILNSAPTINSQAFGQASPDKEAESGSRGYTSLILNSTEVPTLYYGGWETFLNGSENTFANLKKEGVHIYVPDGDTLVRCYSAWAEMIDKDYGTMDDEGNITPQPVTAFLLRIKDGSDQQELYTDTNGVVYMRGDDGDTLMYAPASLKGYYEVSEKVKAIAPGAFAECTQLSGVIVNPRKDGKLPALGEHAFAKPDETGYAAPSDILKIYVSSTLEGEDEWRKALKEQYWHTNEEEKAANADELADLIFESDYESYRVDSGSLYATTGVENADGEEMALLRVNETSSGMFEVLDNTVKIEAFAFAGCEDITGLANIDKVKEIGDTAFLDCKSLNVVALPAALESLGDCAFLGCSRLEAVAFNSMPKMGDDLFTQANIPTVFLPSGAHASASEAQQVRDAMAANGCEAFENCAYEDGTYTLMHSSPGWYATRYYRGLYSENGAESEIQVSFAGSHLGDPDWGDAVDGMAQTTINLDDRVVEIAEGAFAEQDCLTGVYGGTSIAKIGDGAFRNCPELHDVELGMDWSNVEWIGNDAFNGCASLATFLFPLNGAMTGSDTFHIGDRAFKDTDIATTGYEFGYFPRFGFPDGMKVEIGEEAFSGCESIWKLYLPEGDTEIGDRAFAGCTSLVMAYSVSNSSEATVNIGKEAFCDSPIEFLSVGGSKVNVGSGAFASASDMYGLFIADGGSVSADAFAEGSVSKHVVGTCPNNVNAGASYSSEGVDAILPTKTSENVYAEGDTFIAVSYDDDSSKTRTVRYAGNDIVVFDVANIDSGKYILGDGAFEGSTALEELSLESPWRGGTIVGLGDCVFKDCVNLTNTGLSRSIDISEIGKSCYEGCTSVTRTDISYFTTAVGDYAFKGCTSLTNVDHWWTTDARYSDCTLGKGVFEGCTELVDYTSSAYLQSIGSDCFKGCDKMVWYHPWIGDPNDASTSNLPKLAAHPFGTDGSGADIVLDAGRILIFYRDMDGVADTDAAGLSKLFTDANGWLPFKFAFTYQDADRNLTTLSRGKAAPAEKSEADDQASAAGGDDSASNADASNAEANGADAGAGDAATESEAGSDTAVDSGSEPDAAAGGSADADDSSDKVLGDNVVDAEDVEDTAAVEDGSASGASGQESPDNTAAVEGGQ